MKVIWLKKFRDGEWCTAEQIVNLININNVNIKVWKNESIYNEVSGDVYLTSKIQ